VTHLLVTNDFPPKVGGIQTYLWELWRRLPPEETVVLTTGYPGAPAFDGAAPFPVHRTRQSYLVPTRRLARQVDRLADRVGADVVVLDPALPLGLLGPWLSRPYWVVLHGAEVTVPGRLPGTRNLLRRVLRGAAHVVAAGNYPAAEGERAAGRSLPTTVVAPGVDLARFRPLPPDRIRQARVRFGLPAEGRVVVSVSRLVPRKGMDVLIQAAARLAPARPDLVVAIAGTGRDRKRLQGLVARHEAPVRFLGRVSDDDLPALYGCADVFAMLCRNRWLGLEQEGFGIVFLEAAACGVPSVAGDSGGVADAVVDGATGLVVRRPADVGAATLALARLLDDPGLRLRLGQAALRRAEREFAPDHLAARLRAAFAGTTPPGAARASPGEAGR
jgi:phosphatidylinositol alpha-1,6-mannosyltransferase